jgi:hypothetical protein
LDVHDMLSKTVSTFLAKPEGFSSEHIEFDVKTSNLHCRICYLEGTIRYFFIAS